MYTVGSILLYIFLRGDEICGDDVVGGVGIDMGVGFGEAVLCASNNAIYKEITIGEELSLLTYLTFHD